MILACDVGGTKTNVALFEERGDSLEMARFETYPSREHGGLHQIVDRFTGGRPPRGLAAAGFGIAGPVIGGQVQTTNLPWVVDGERLARLLGLRAVSLLNDVEAHAWSVERLAPGDLVSLQEGRERPGNAAVIAAGTGLGFAALVRGGGATVSLASEGGHADFAPRGDLEMELVRHLQVRFGHVSCERVVSGPGLLDVYLFLRDTGRGEEPPWLAEEMRGGDPSAAVSQAGLEGRSPLCALALDTFLAAYGAEAGNWALRTLATGGVFLGGGIAAKVFCGPRGVRPGPRDVFLRAFLDKGRMRPLLEATPVRVIVNDRAALIGSAHLARREARRGERGAP